MQKRERDGLPKGVRVKIGLGSHGLTNSKMEFETHFIKKIFLTCCVVTCELHRAVAGRRQLEVALSAPHYCPV